MMIKRLTSLILALVLIFSMSSLSFGAVQDVAIPDLKSGWSASGGSSTVTSPSGYGTSWFYYLLRFVQNIGLPGDTGSSTIIGSLKGLNNALAGSATAGSSTNNILSKVGTISDKIITLQSDVTSYIKPYLQTISNKVTLIDSTANNIKTNTDTVVSKLGNTYTSGSVLYYLSNILSTDGDILTQSTGIHSDTSAMLPLVRRIRDMVGDDDDYRRKQESESNNQSFEDNFLTGDNSVGTSDIGALSGLGTSFKDFFSMTGAGGGSAEVDISSWSDILLDDEAFTFFTEADSIAESMGVEAGGHISNPGEDPGGGGGDTPGGGDEPVIPPTPPDEDDFPNDGNVYVRCIGLDNAYGSTPSIGGVQITDEFTVLNPGDYIHISLGVHRGYGYFCSVNGVFFGYEDPNFEDLQPYFSNNITIEFFKVSTDEDTFNQNLNLIYRPSVQAPMRMLCSAPLDTSNEVVTHYYQDNLNTLLGYLRGD